MIQLLLPAAEMLTPNFPKPESYLTIMTTPLYLDVGGLGPSWLEKACRYLPIFGWIISSELEQRRNLPAISGVGRQLESRPKPPTEIWGNERRSSLATLVGTWVKDELNWPNANFIPADPFGILFLNDDGAGVEVLRSIENYLCLPSGFISNEDFQRMQAMSFGEVIDYALSIASLQHSH